MAQEGIVDLPNANYQASSTQPVQFPVKGESPKTSDAVTEAALQSSSNSTGSPQESIINNPAESDNDEVQFVFSVPRRRKKKRKRVGSTAKTSSILRDSDMSTSPPNSRPTSTSKSSQTIRRGSTGMVQQLESCYMSGNTQSSTKSGSLPTIARTSQPHLPNSQFVASPSPDMLLQSSASLPFEEALPWWNIQNPLMQEIGSFQFDICGMPFAEEVLKKRKHDDGPQDLSPQPGSSQWCQNKRPAVQTCYFSEPVRKTPGGLTGESSVASANSSFQKPVRTTETQTTQGLASPLAIPDNFIPSQNLSSFSRSEGFINPLERQSHQQQPWQIPSSGQQYQNEWAQQQIIQVPVSLVPELSVSPRTKTVQVFRPVNPVQVQLQKMASTTPLPPKTTTPMAPAPEQASTNASTSLMNLSTPGISSNIPRQTRNGVPFLQTIPSDVQRKPSLYKIPPWPSPPISSHVPLYMGAIHFGSRTEASKRSPNQTQLLPTQSTIPIAGVDSPHIKRPPREETYAKAYVLTKVISASNSSGDEQIPNAVPGTGQSRTTEPIRQVSPATNTTSFSSRITNQTSPSTRKHSPNLIVDIAETCQEHFPFAAVAQRHKQPIQKVFDTFSAIIQLPLLRSAADNRRHGDLAKTRMKEFRDAKKAMEKAQELERKKVRELSKTESGDIAVPKTPKKAPGLLKAAILNNARGKDGDLES